MNTQQPQVEIIENTLPGSTQIVYRLYILDRGFGVTRNGDGTFLVAKVNAEGTKFSSIETVGTLKAALDTMVRDLIGTIEIFTARRALQEALISLYQ